MKKIYFYSLLYLFGLLILCLLSCRRQPQATLTDLVPITPALESLPLDSTLDLGHGITLTRISATKALRTVPLGTPRKVKIKNSGNTLVDNSQKKSGNSDSFNRSKKSANSDAFNDNKKQSQQKKSGNPKLKDVGNQKLKDVGNTQPPSNWPLWLFFFLLIALLGMVVFHKKK